PGIAVDPVTQRGFEIPRIDDEAGLVWLTRGKASLYKPLPTALIPSKPIPQTAQQAALRALAEQATGTVTGPNAAFELLLRMPPRLRGDTLGERVAQLGGSALFIQGPPGSGKTYTGARLICELLAGGRRVGVAATSHKAIANLLDEVERAAAEAGQMALADALAVAGAGGGLVLLGDPQQLAHVSQGTHPRGSGASVLEHLLGDRETVPPAEGVFLERTWRMHPDVCRFVSAAMYEGRLQAVEGAERQVVASPGLSGAGVRLLEVEHTENRQSAPEEADRIAEEVAKLLDGGRYTDAAGAERDLTLDDILVVTPFNAQVRHLRTRLPRGARIGTVDKFQGQEAPGVFVS